MPMFGDEPKTQKNQSDSQSVGQRPLVVRKTITAQAQFSFSCI